MLLRYYTGAVGELHHIPMGVVEVVACLAAQAGDQVHAAKILGAHASHGGEHGLSPIPQKACRGAVYRFALPQAVGQIAVAGRGSRCLYPDLPVESIILV